ncbi:MAG: methyltransferase family protein [Pyrinomonadaceae bacterium]
MNTDQISFYVNAVTFGAVILLWFVFAGTFLLSKKPESAPDAKRAPGSWAGLVLQGAGFGIVWSVRRSPVASPLIEGQFALNIGLQIVAVVLAITSVWLAMSAIKELGKQWSLAARLTEGHKLVTTGVYGIVRHPIYTAMFGMLLATGIAFTHWIALLIAMVIFYIGTKIRTHFEEGLLRDAFGDEFKTWEARVPGLIPFLKI